MKKNKDIVVTFLRHYATTDKEYTEDYYDSEILVNGKELIKLGSFDAEFEPDAFYEGFIEGVKFAEKFCKAKFDFVQFEYDHVADYE